MLRAESLVEQALAVEESRADELIKLEQSLTDRLFKDDSADAKKGRRLMALRAGYGEFMCTLLFLTPIFGAVGNYSLFTNISGSTIVMIAAFVSGFQAVAVAFTFSSVSGAHFNPAISWALWLTGKLSNRKVFLYVCVQMMASVLAMAIIGAIFGTNRNEIYDACAVVPTNGDRLGEVFATEFFLTFFLTYIAFTVVFEDSERSKKETMSFKTISDSRGLTLYASTPQSKTGFAPFAIGFTIFSLNLIGGESGGAFNPARMFGPAVFR